MLECTPRYSRLEILFPVSKESNQGCFYFNPFKLKRETEHKPLRNNQQRERQTCLSHTGCRTEKVPRQSTRFYGREKVWQ